MNQQEFIEKIDLALEALPFREGVCGAFADVGLYDQRHLLHTLFGTEENAWHAFYLGPPGFDKPFRATCLLLFREFMLDTKEYENF